MEKYFNWKNDALKVILLCSKFALYRGEFCNLSKDVIIFILCWKFTKLSIPFPCESCWKNGSPYSTIILGRGTVSWASVDLICELSAQICQNTSLDRWSRPRNSSPSLSKSEYTITLLKSTSELVSESDDLCPCDTLSLSLS